MSIVIEDEICIETRAHDPTVILDSLPNDETATDEDHIISSTKAEGDFPDITSTIVVVENNNDDDDDVSSDSGDEDGGDGMHFLLMFLFISPKFF